MQKDKNIKVWYASKSLKWGETKGENRSVWHLNAVTPIMCIFKLFSQLKFVTKVNIVTPYISPYGYPNDVPVGQNRTQKLEDTNVLIPWYPISYLTIAM